MSTKVAFEKGLLEIADGVFAYVQPDGSYGWSNAGLVTGDGTSLLVDTLFDLALTAEMLDSMRPHTRSAPIATVVNTHADGDHWFGNQLVAGDSVEFIASRATADEMEENPSPDAIAALLATDLGPELNAFGQRAFGAFCFDDIELVSPTATFSGELCLDVGGTAAELYEVGPAHTAGDVLAWVPSPRVLFAGDILFIGGTPVMWSGPIENWVAACERIIELDPVVVVPGHGPLTDVDGVRQVADYLRFVGAEARQRFEAGMSVLETVAELDRAIDGQPWSEWPDRERIHATVESVFATWDPTRERAPFNEVLQRMATYGES